MTEGHKRPALFNVKPAARRARYYLAVYQIGHNFFSKVCIESGLVVLDVDAVASEGRDSLTGSGRMANILVGAMEVIEKKEAIERSVLVPLLFRVRLCLLRRSMSD